MVRERCLQRGVQRIPLFADRVQTTLDSLSRLGTSFDLIIHR